MDIPPSAPHPKPMLPFHLLNGGSPLRASRRPSVGRKERERLAASIVTSTKPRVPIDLRASEDLLVDDSEDDSNVTSRPTATPNGLSELEVEARDPRDEAPHYPPISDRPASPYTLNPPIDFDGLSWPSEKPRATCGQW